MAEIEDERATRESRKHGIDFFIKCAAARAQDQWIEITLHRNARLDFLVRKIAVDAVFEADGIDPGFIDIARNIFPGAAWKTNHFGAGSFCTQLRNKPFGRLHAPALEILRRQRARPSIENLYDIGAGFKLVAKIIDRCIDQTIDQMLKSIG